VWTGRAVTPAAEAELVGALGVARTRAHGWLTGPGRATLAIEDVMRALAASVSAYPGEGAPTELVALVGVTAAAWGARRAGVDAPAPDPSRGHAADLLRMVARREVSEAEARALEAYLVTVMDHGMNASTFTARVVASTAAPNPAAVAAAIGALSGPLHGGAPGPVLDMLDAVARDGDARRWLRGELDAGRRIMGMGHRVYRVRDPRVVVLEGAVEALRAAGHGSPRLRVAREVEQAAEALLAEKYPARALKANVELATAVLLDAIGVPRELFSAMFACGRVVGWLGHVAEQRATGRLIRPESRYVGPGRPGA
jgi:citrate synthase